jgi:hypothetical protein
MSEERFAFCKSAVIGVVEDGVEDGDEPLAPGIELLMLNQSFLHRELHQGMHREAFSVLVHFDQTKVS